MNNDVEEELIEDEGYSGWEEPPPPLSTSVKVIALVTVIALLIASIWWVSLL